MVRLASLSIFSLACFVACGDNAKIAPGVDAGPDAPPSDGGTEPPGIGLAVVNSDYASTSISLLDRTTGQVVKGDCINSGTRPPGNTLALSGDVVLPSQAQPSHLLLAIDRTNGALTWIDPSTCTPLHQLDVSTGFKANPHDVIGVSPSKAYVTRYERNLAATPDPADRDDGDDLLIIDPSVPAITGRIALSSYATTVAGATIQARPDRAQLVNGKLVVVLGNISDNFGTIGPARLVVIDPATDQVTSTVDLPGLKNCGGLSYVERTKVLVVACGGDYNDANQVASSGLAFVDIGASPPVQTRQLAATPFGGRALGGFSGIANGGALGFGVTVGESGARTPKDQFWMLDVASGGAAKLADASDSFTYGTVLVDPARQRAYLTDANAAMPRVQVYEYANPTAPTRATSINASPSGLPSREIEWY